MSDELEQPSEPPVPGWPAESAQRLEKARALEALGVAPYPTRFERSHTLGEVVADQHVFELREVSGTVVGFRFPDYAEGLEVSGYHLHFISGDRSRGGHLLECRPTRGRVGIDPSTDLHVELPPGIDLGSSEIAESTREVLRRAEHDA